MHLPVCFLYISMSVAAWGYWYSYAHMMLSIEAGLHLHYPHYFNVDDGQVYQFTYVEILCNWALTSLIIYRLYFWRFICEISQLLSL